jgi:hypothetical protein
MPTPAVKRRLPGKAKPRVAALAAYERTRVHLVAGLSDRRSIALAPYAAPAPEDLFRWRVQLDCGCIHELLVFGDDKAPDEHQWRDDVHFNLLPAGQLMCRHEGQRLSVPYREITRWGTRKDEPSPGERPDKGDELAVRRAKRDRRAPARWEVTLSCGHVTEVVVEDGEWTPAVGPVRREVSPERLARENARLDADLAERQDGDAHLVEMVEHTRRWWSDGCPRPATEAICHACDEARQIVAYEPVGWLVTRSAAQGLQAQQTRATLVRRLRAAESEADRLRERLAALDALEGGEAG